MEAVQAAPQATSRAASSIRDNPFMQGNARPEQAAVRADMVQAQARALRETRQGPSSSMAAQRAAQALREVQAQVQAQARTLTLALTLP